MSVQPSGIDNQDYNDAEFEAASGGAWRAKGCRGCGQGPEDLARIDAIGVAAFLERRFASLLDNPEHSLRDRGPGRGSWSAMEPAAKVSDVLGAADARLRDLLGEETLEPVLTAIETRRSVPYPQSVPAVFAALAENVRRLTATIVGATAEDWRRGQAYDGATAGELVWSALHDATHHLEDAELLLDAAWARDKTPRPAADIPGSGSEKTGGAGGRRV